MIAAANSRRGDRGETIPKTRIRSSAAIFLNILIFQYVNAFACFYLLEYAARLPKNPILNTAGG
jgi:hypothetical protein